MSNQDVNDQIDDDMLSRICNGDKAKIEEMKEQGESTCVALIRMLTSNMRILVTDDYKQRHANLKQNDNSSDL